MPTNIDYSLNNSYRDTRPWGYTATHKRNEERQVDKPTDPHPSQKAKGNNPLQAQKTREVADEERQRRAQR